MACYLAQYRANGRPEQLKWAEFMDYAMTLTFNQSDILNMRPVQPDEVLELLEHLFPHITNQQKRELIKPQYWRYSITRRAYFRGEGFIWPAIVNHLLKPVLFQLIMNGDPCLWQEEEFYTLCEYLVMLTYTANYPERAYFLPKICSLCQSHIQGTAIVTLCEHRFHQDCLKMVLNQSGLTCPDCGKLLPEASFLNLYTV